MASLRLLGYLAVPVLLAAATPTAKDLAKKAEQAENRGDWASAYLYYAQAAAANPDRAEYWQRSQALQRRATVAAKVMPAMAPASAAAVQALPEPLPEAARPEIEEARRPQPPIELQGPPERKVLDMRGDARQLWEQMSKTFGFEPIFDGDFQAGQPVRFRMDDTDYREALQALMTVTGTFIVPLSEKIFLVVKDTEQKRREVENTVAVTIPIPDPVTLQEAQEVARAVQQLMEIQRFAIDSAQRMVVLRDRVSKVWPAQELLRQLLYGRTQVAMEVELITVAKTTSLAYGLNLQTSSALAALGDYGRSKASIPERFTNFLVFGGGKSFLGLGLLGAELIANMYKASGTTLLRADVRSSDGNQVQFTSGLKYPIMTNGYFGDTSGGGEIFTPPPTFQFEDLGLVLKMTPKVHDRGELTLDIEAEFKLLTGQSFNGIPVIGNRKIANRVRLRFGEWAVIGGLVSNEKARTVSGLPYVGAILGKTETREDESQTLLLIKPRLMSLPTSELLTRTIWIGPETRPRTPL